jgi:hypothetical protein
MISEVGLRVLEPDERPGNGLNIRCQQSLCLFAKRKVRSTAYLLRCKISVRETASENTLGSYRYELSRLD